MTATFTCQLGLALCLAAPVALAQEDAAEGERLSIIGGCHDCHTAGYAESGEVDPEAALKGSPVGWQGPWGTTYAKNLRLTASEMDADEWVDYMSTIQTLPPMPWFNLHSFTDSEARALHTYITSLGEPGDPMPQTVAPGEVPETPFIVMVPQAPEE